MRERGQALIFTVVLIPTLLLICGVIARTGKTLLVHQRLQNHCDRKILDALAAQARGLALLGKINPLAKKIIDLRRTIDKALESGEVPPNAIPALAAEETALRAAQQVFSSMQKEVAATACAESQMILKKPSTADVGKSKEAFGPSNPLLHVEDQPPYENETGAPKELDKDFDKRQRARGVISIGLEKYLPWWRGFTRSGDVAVECEAKIEMESLEDQWKVILVASGGKPLSRAFSPSH